jgi:hypothetical protein
MHQKAVVYHTVYWLGLGRFKTNVNPRQMDEGLAQGDKAKHCSVNSDTIAFHSTFALRLSYEEDMQ